MGVIGLGGRGQDLLQQAILPRAEVAITALCDRYQDRVDDTAAKVKAAGNVTEPALFTDAYACLESGTMDAVLISTSWEEHIPLACRALELGIAVAMEVGGAYSEQELWTLVEVYEKTRTPFMFMENCCFGRDELMVRNMVKQGILGEVVHCAGGYLHDLRDEIAGGEQNRHYRLENYLHRNTENYPTHEIGPIARVLDLNRGNRMLTLTSVASRAAGMTEYLEQNDDTYPELKGRIFRQGDVVSTTITCAGGQTIHITLDTTLPRYYSRGFTVSGTKGMYCEENQSIFLDSEESHRKAHFSWRAQWGNVENYRGDFDHPIWQAFLADEVRGGHGGMDWLEFDAFFEALKSGEPMPIDVYDAASWMVISVLAEQSIALGGQPVAFPDFTRGRWITR